MRNSVKVVIDAYDGTVDAYIADPATRSCGPTRAIFGGDLQAARARCPPTSARTSDIRAICSACRRRSTRHITWSQPDAFYHREDQWQIPACVTRRTERKSVHAPHHHAAAGRSESRVHLHDAVHAAREGQSRGVDGGANGRRRTTASSSCTGSRSRVSCTARSRSRTASTRTPSISRQLTLWDQRGSQVIRGELLVIPIEESLIYVQPLYLRAEGGSIPELKRVVVAHENRVVMGETLEEGLNALFGSGAATQTTSVQDSLSALGRRVLRRFGGAVATAHGAAPPSGAVGDLFARRRRITTARSPRSAPATGRSTAGRSSSLARRSVPPSGTLCTTRWIRPAPSAPREGISRRALQEFLDGFR